MSLDFHRLIEERLPVELGWKPPQGKIGLRSTLRLISEMGKIQKQKKNQAD